MKKAGVKELRGNEWKIEEDSNVEREKGIYAKGWRVKAEVI